MLSEQLGMVFLEVETEVLRLETVGNGDFGGENGGSKVGFPPKYHDRGF